ncbi:MAG: outer membrane beta-barrel protein [Bacteroidia bacterium]|nr:outer membrane beta-barrel protein [Bacteroidia bacterium]
MKDKKHIDELFKEQLQDYEAAPPSHLWSGIQGRLKKKDEDRKVIPLWWKAGGVAALIALLLTIGNFVFSPSEEIPDKTFVIEEVDPLKDPDSQTTILSDKKMTQEAISEEKSSEVIKGKEGALVRPDAEKSEKAEQVNTTENSREAIAVEENKEQAIPKKSQEVMGKETLENVRVKTEDAVATRNEVKAAKAQNENKTVPKTDPLIKKEVEEGIAKKVADAVAKTTEVQKDKVDPETTKENEVLIRKDKKVTDQSKEEAVAKVEKQEETVKDDIKEENKKSIFDAIEEKEEEAIAQKDDRDIKPWEVTPNFGPVYYSSLGEGSSIDPAFSDNSQTGDVNFSYGVQVSYNLNDRLSLRSGVSNVNLGYTTGGVELATGPVGIALETVDYGGKGVVLTAFDKGTLANLPQNPENGNPFANLNPKSTSGNAELIQNLSYYEVPMELKYALTQSRFGLNVIGGFSTLFLDNNEISVRDGSFRDVLGAANNLNSVSFSTNVGLGFDYKISKRLKLNVEPMFKYQLNPYTDSSVDFKPYYFGVYSGLSFKF